jgi:predicted  nucleic acid-binding Zn-ribbon protein
VLCAEEGFVGLINGHTVANVVSNRTWEHVYRGCKDQVATLKGNLEKKKQLADNEKVRADTAMEKLGTETKRANDEKVRADTAEEKLGKETKRANDEKVRADTAEEKLGKETKRADTAEEKLRKETQRANDAEEKLRAYNASLERAASSNLQGGSSMSISTANGTEQAQGELTWQQGSTNAAKQGPGKEGSQAVNSLDQGACDMRENGGDKTQLRQRTKKLHQEEIDKLKTRYTELRESMAAMNISMDLMKQELAKLQVDRCGVLNGMANTGMQW